MFKHDYLSPLILQLTGLVLLIVFVVFWMVTGHESTLLVGSALTLAGVGSASGAIKSAKDEIAKVQQQDKGGSSS